MSFTPDDQANDGGPGEGANVHSDVEHLTDYITQGIQSGADAYWGSDLSYYSEGTLLVRGTAGANTLTGGLNNDDLDGLAGNDIVSGGIGDDRVNAIDGFADAVFCGPGNDTVAADTLDEVSETCETVERSNAGNANDTPEDAAPTVALDATTRALTASAADDRGIASVAFVDDDRVVCVDDTAPYSCDYAPRGDDVGRNTLTAIATDTAGQTASDRKLLAIGRFAPAGLTLKVSKRRAAWPRRPAAPGRSVARVHRLGRPQGQARHEDDDEAHPPEGRLHLRHADQAPSAARRCRRCSPATASSRRSAAHRDAPRDADPAAGPRPCGDPHGRAAVACAPRRPARRGPSCRGPSREPACRRPSLAPAAARTEPRRGTMRHGSSRARRTTGVGIRNTGARAPSLDATSPSPARVKARRLALPARVRRPHLHDLGARAERRGHVAAGHPPHVDAAVAAHRDARQVRRDVAARRAEPAVPGHEGRRHDVGHLAQHVERRRDRAPAGPRTAPRARRSSS